MSVAYLGLVSAEKKIETILAKLKYSFYTLYSVTAAKVFTQITLGLSYRDVCEVLFHIAA